MKYMLLTACLLALSWLQGIPLYRMGRTRDLWVFGVLLAAGAALGYAHLGGFPLRWIPDVLLALFGPVMRVLRAVLTGAGAG